jgi:hypothetical protein
MEFAGKGMANASWRTAVKVVSGSIEAELLERGYPVIKMVLRLSAMVRIARGLLIAASVSLSIKELHRAK